MSGTSNLPSLDALKDQAKRLRKSLEAAGNATSHSQSLELLAHQMGYRDWNTLHASVGNQLQSPPVILGQRVSGAYLGHRFEGSVIGVRMEYPGDRFRITVKFDEPVDVFAFEGMSAFRQRVTSVIGYDGRTAEKTSNGEPQMKLDLQRAA